MGELMLRRVHPRTVNPVLIGKHCWFESNLTHHKYRHGKEVIREQEPQASPVQEWTGRVLQQDRRQVEGC